MKKLILSTAILSASLFASAQTEQLNIVLHNGTVTTIDVADIKEMNFTAGEEPEPELMHSFDGYLLVTSNFFAETYHGDKATIKVYKNGDGYMVTFSDPVWGEGVFNDVEVGRELKGEGSLTMTYNGKEGTYDATIGGSMTAPVITLPGVMGGCTIRFMVGEAPEAYKIAGKYEGQNAVSVGEMATYTTTMTYEIIANADGTVNLVTPEYKLSDTVMGDLTLGTYIIPNIPYDADKKVFTLSYGDTGVNQHFKAEKEGTVTMDSEYDLKDPSVVTIKMTDNGIEVTNDFKLGNMPFLLSSAFTQSAAE